MTHCTTPPQKSKKLFFINDLNSNNCVKTLPDKPAESPYFCTPLSLLRNAYSSSVWRGSQAVE